MSSKAKLRVGPRTGGQATLGTVVARVQGPATD